MRAEARRSVLPAATLPLIAVALLGACRSEAETVAEAPAPAPPKAAPNPVERAQQLVQARVGQPLAFAGTQVFDSKGATIVCGRYEQPDRPPLRYIAVGEEDVFVEGDFSGDMDQAAAEACRNS